MAYLVTGSGLPGSVSRTFSVDYIATGTEGTDFDVPIGVSMIDGTYSVTAQSAGGTSGDGTESNGVELLDIPKAGRTTTHFRVVTGASLTAGDVLEFAITGAVVLS